MDLRVADDFLKKLGAALRAGQLYAPSHPLVQKAFETLNESLTQMLTDDQTFTIGIIGNEIIVGDIPLPKAAETMGETIRRLKSLGIERIAFDRGVTPDQVQTLALTIAHPERRPGATAPGAEPADPLGVLNSLPNIRVGRIQTEERKEVAVADIAAIRKLYGDATNVAATVWEIAKAEGTPDPKAARALVDSLAQAVSANRTALIALTALKNYDNYTFTHMVNVSLLTMGQARGLGLDGALLREFGLAALMHDIGKVRTPLEILNKPDKLTDAEFAIMKRHTIDGAEILRGTPDIPTLAPVVAFEHHLRIDGTGYPVGVNRPSLNIGTMLCSISDVYDAMRSQRKYQQAFPTERILAVLKRDDGQQFDRHLVRRFVQLIGIYPPGNLVKLSSGEIAVVTKVYAPDPYRPKVKIVIDKQGSLVNKPYVVNLWEMTDESAATTAIVAPVDSEDLFGIDPLTLI